MQQKIHVMLISGTLDGGGAERFTSTLLAHLDRSRFSPSLCLLRNRIGYPLPDDVCCTVLDGTAGSEGHGRDTPLASRAVYRPWIVWRTIRNLRHHIETARPDVVISTINQINCATASALRGAAHQPVWVARVGNSPAQEDRWTRWWARWSYSRANWVVANSGKLADDVAQRYLAGHQRISVIGNPTDFALIDRLATEPSRWSAEAAYPVVLSVGRLSKQKRPDILLDAFSRVRRHIPAHLWVCGTGPLRDSIAQEVTFRGLDASVQMPGFCQNPYSLMRQAAVFAMTSDYEGLPNALIEAQGLGVPAVASECPFGPDEIVRDGRTGYLTSPGDAPAAAQAIARLLGDPARRSAMGQAAAARARKLYDVSTLVPKWEELILNCAAPGVAPLATANATTAIAAPENAAAAA